MKTPVRGANGEIEGVLGGLLGHHRTKTGRIPNQETEPHVCGS